LERLERWMGTRYCPVCERWSRRFHSYGYVKRKDAACPRCGSLERHRLVWLHFARATNLFDGQPKRVLHIAPEGSLEARLRKVLGDGYLSADLEPGAMVQMDICDIRYPDASFDAVFCSHVLEHVPDDRRAMRELRRVLRPSGFGVLQVPISVERTVEDPSISDPAERMRLFGHPDHVRRYGHDYVDRLREAGFRVSVREPRDIVQEKDLVPFGLSRIRERIYHCERA
jgi:SAM-dependent methyltransferase